MCCVYRVELEEEEKNHRKTTRMKIKTHTEYTITRNKRQSHESLPDTARKCDDPPLTTLSTTFLLLHPFAPSSLALSLAHFLPSHHHPNPIPISPIPISLSSLPPPLPLLHPSGFAALALPSLESFSPPSLLQPYTLILSYTTCLKSERSIPPLLVSVWISFALLLI